MCLKNAKSSSDFTGETEGHGSKSIFLIKCSTFFGLRMMAGLGCYWLSNGKKYIRVRLFANKRKTIDRRRKLFFLAKM